MTLKQSTIFCLFFITGLCGPNPQAAYATAIVDSSIVFSNLQIVSAGGTVQFQGSGEAQAFAQASNSNGELNSDFQSSTGGQALADAVVTFAESHGRADAADLSGSAANHIDLTGAVEQQAVTTASGTLFNSFIITGGTGDVQVEFSADLTGSLSVFTDEFGITAETETIFSMDLDGTPILFRHDLRSVGPNDSSSLAFSDSLSNLVTLQFDTEYFTIAEAHNNSSAASRTPEPGTLALLLTGLGVLFGLGRKKTGSRSV